MRDAKKILITSTAVGAASKGVLNIIKQYEKKKLDPNYEFSFEDLFFDIFEGGGLGLAIGVGLCGINHLMLNDYDDETPIKKSTYLREVLASYNEQENFDGMLKAKKVIKKLHSEFRNELVSKPDLQGSVAKGTAIENSDIDIAARFNHHSFPTLESMYDEVYDYFRNDFCDEDLIKVIRQRHSIGLVFDCSGEETHIDVVPRRRLQNNQGYTLYVAANNMFAESSHKKTNTAKHFFRGKHAQSMIEISQLLKIMKTEYDIPLKGFLIERMVKQSYEEAGTQLPKPIDRRLMNTLAWIRDNIETARVLDPGNSNNELTAYLSDGDRRQICHRVESIYDHIEEDARVLRKYFR